MSEIMYFIKDNFLSIAIIVITVLLLLAIIKIKEIDLNPPKPESKLVQQVTVETLDTMNNTLINDALLEENMNLNPNESFCESYLGNSAELEGACNDLTESNCATTKCCVYTAEKCVAGNKDGPKYKTDKDGKLLTIDSYYYLGKCRGPGCPT